MTRYESSTFVVVTYSQRCGTLIVEAGLTGSLGRIVAIALALAITVGAWLLFEYSEASRHGEATDGGQRGFDVSPPPAVDSYSASARAIPDPISNSSATAGRPPGSFIYKCRGPTGIAYRDHPCSSKETELQVTVADPPSPPRNDLAQLKVKADAMEAARLHREATQSAVQAQAQAQAEKPMENPRKTACDAIDREIDRVDSWLRQPHSASSGDFWTGERRKLTDRRFSLGC